VFKNLWGWLFEPRRKERREEVKARIEELLKKEGLGKQETEELDDLLLICRSEVIFLERK
jgi:hypothetical protein